MIVAVDQVVPLLIETLTDSPPTRLDARVPLMVCDAVLVMRSVLETPVSAEKIIVLTVLVGAVKSLVISMLVLANVGAPVKVASCIGAVVPVPS